MPRKHPEPFWRTQTNCWYVQLGKKQVRLHPDRDEAFRLYHALMAMPREAETPHAPSPAMSVVELIDLFLDWVAHNRERPTYEAYQRRLQALVDILPPTLACGELKPYHLTRVMDAKAWNANTKNDFAVAVQRVYNWAMRQGLVDRNPVAYVEKPGRVPRELALSPKDYAEVMAKVGEPRFRELLELAWETGARVQELRILEGRHVELSQARIVLPPSEAKGKRHHRVIYLGTERARELIKTLCERHPKGPILLNSVGRPWTKDAINCAFCRLKKKIGRKLHLGAWRKGFATEALKNGVDVHTTAHLLGHANSAMLSKVYARVQADPEFMAGAARKAKGG